MKMKLDIRDIVLTSFYKRLYDIIRYNDNLTLGEIDDKLKYYFENEVIDYVIELGVYHKFILKAQKEADEDKRR